MFSIDYDEKVNNIAIALQAANDFLGKKYTSIDDIANHESEVQELYSHFAQSPERNIFLWLLNVVLEVTAPNSWWYQVKLYNVDVFLTRREERNETKDRLLSMSDFEGSISPETLDILNNYVRDGHYDTVIKLLPLNFIQRGYIKIDYNTMHQIYNDKRSVLEEHWHSFIQFVRKLPFHQLFTY